MKNFILGTTKSGAKHSPVRIDTLKLVDNRLLGCANSGGGKSWMLRRLIEQAGKSVQVIVLDPEGEFGTLREKLDMVLAGAEGEVEAHPRSAKLLCRKLLELRLSAVVDLYDLKMHERRSFVRYFLESMITAPRSMWGSVLVVLDEAHKFAPEKGQAESTSAVIDLMSQGRKRGFGGVLVTQRLSKLHKDAVGEANNVLLGRCTQDVDLKRANDILGLPPRDKTLRGLQPGEWFGFGPAIGDGGDIVRLKVGKVETTHPDPRNRSALIPPKPSRKIQAVLGEFEGLADKAEEKAATEAELRAQIARLERELAVEKRRMVPQTVVDQDAIAEGARKAAYAVNNKWQAWVERFKASLFSARSDAQSVLNKIDGLQSYGEPDIDIEGVLPARKKVAHKKRKAPVSAPAPARSTNVSVGDDELKPSAKKILGALALFPDGLNKKRLGTITGLATRGGSFNTTMKDLRDSGYMDGGRGAPFVITPTGRAAMGDAVETVPSAGDERVAFWRGKLSGCAVTIFDAFVEHYPEPLSKDDIGNFTGLATRGGAFNTAMRDLKDHDLISGRGTYHLSPDLFE